MSDIGNYDTLGCSGPVPEDIGGWNLLDHPLAGAFMAFGVTAGMGLALANTAWADTNGADDYAASMQAAAVAQACPQYYRIGSMFVGDNCSAVDLTADNGVPVGHLNRGAGGAGITVEPDVWFDGATRHVSSDTVQICALQGQDMMTQPYGAGHKSFDYL